MITICGHSPMLLHPLGDAETSIVIRHWPAILREPARPHSREAHHCVNFKIIFPYINCFMIIFIFLYLRVARSFSSSSLLVLFFTNFNTLVSPDFVTSVFASFLDHFWIQTTAQRATLFRLMSYHLSSSIFTFLFQVAWKKNLHKLFTYGKPDSWSSICIIKGAAFKFGTDSLDI